MAARSLMNGSMISAQQQGYGRGWLVSCTDQNVQNLRDLTPVMPQTKLSDKEAVFVHASIRAPRTRLPAPIVIERKLQLSDKHEDLESTRSSISFTALSEEKLHFAIQLAKRDMRRRCLESLTKSPPKAEDPSVELLQPREPEATPNKKNLVANSKKNPVEPGAKRSALTFKKNPIGPSPPTTDPGPQKLGQRKTTSLSEETQKLYNEFEVYIQKIENLANRGEKTEEPLDPGEQNKLEIRRQKQAVRSAQTIYVLQQQVKEIQEDIEALRTQERWNTKKSLTVNRLAAAHRGALRALQGVNHQLSDMPHGQMLPYCKELGQLIRQLSLCSAKVELEEDSAVSETVFNILQKLETLDSALSKQEMVEKMQAQACPPPRRSPQDSRPPTRAPKGPSMSSVQRYGKPLNLRRGALEKRMAPQKPEATSHQDLNRREVLMAGLERLAQQRELNELQRQRQTNTSSRKEVAPHSDRSMGAPPKVQNAGFQQPTVSSQLRVNQLPQRDHFAPWIPTSPHSPPPQRSPQRSEPEPRCLFSPVKPSTSPLKQAAAGGVATEQPALNSQRKKQAQHEALRKAWLDKVTMLRLQELNQLSKKEAERIQALRSEVYSPTEWAERAEQKARERIQPLLDEAQIVGSRDGISFSLRNRLSEQAAERAAESAEQLSEALLEDLLDDTAKAAWAAEADRQLEDMAERRLQAPTLESMLLRMEEIQRDQDEVRRRVASIFYSDPSCWVQPEAAGPQNHLTGTRPVSPHPVTLTRPEQRLNSAGDIFLEKPMETGHSLLSESSLTEEATQNKQQPTCSSEGFPSFGERNRGTVVSVPVSMLQSIRRYREDYEAYVRVVAQEAVGGFHPWAVVDSLAEELLSEALDDVVTEFQDVVEEYAEAVFTSEFLQPIQSPPAADSPNR
ncbi:protein moonraker isoform X2 [Antennarius striatus]|uniref:protein moonraker isoform X2 n=1 Tax=Antennarius striatus TaxID=241820 RepID=UPI0035ADCA00